VTVFFQATPGQIALIETVVTPASTASTEALQLTGVVDIGTDGVLSIMGVWSPTLADGAEVIVSIFAPDALYRLRATSHRGRSGRLDISPIHDMERVQRRRWPRQQMQLDVMLAPLGGRDPEVSIAGRTLDLGLGGLRVETKQRLPPSADVAVRLTLPDGASLVTRTTVVYADVTDSTCEYGLAFDELDDADAARLNALVDLQGAPPSFSRPR
jgi:hypothetical protein